MDTNKKINRWLSQALHCAEQIRAIATQAEEGQCSAFLAHCQERLEFFAAREQVLTRRMRRLERQLAQELAEANIRLAEGSKRLLDTIYDAVRQRESHPEKEGRWRCSH